MPASLGHLTSRFFEVLRSKPLNPDEAEELSSWLPGGLQPLFFAQPFKDQRHGYQAAQFVIASGETRPAVVVAALMHDIGKRHARLGVVARSLASIMILARVPLPRRIRLYRDHGASGADELAHAKAPDLAVEFTRHHQGPRPVGFDEAAWALLVTADQPQRPSNGLTAR